VSLLRYALSLPATAVRGAAGHGPFYRRLTSAVWAVLVCAALTILTIGARSPYTHSNLGAGYDPRYERTGQILVGPTVPFDGLNRARATGNDPEARGATLYVTEGCVTCHGLEGRGGAVGPEIFGIDQETITQRVREGPAGMPQFSASGLTEEEIADITAFLGSVVDPK
jgi:mono/diheme cytochrome c family protein